MAGLGGLFGRPEAQFPMPHCVLASLTGVGASFLGVHRGKSTRSDGERGDRSRRGRRWQGMRGQKLLQFRENRRFSLLGLTEGLKRLLFGGGPAASPPGHQLTPWVVTSQFACQRASVVNRCRQ